MTDLGRERVQIACEQAVQAAVLHGCSATELRQLMRQAWIDVLHERAEFGAKEFEQ